jgi:hypothetical protein
MAPQGHPFIATCVVQLSQEVLLRIERNRLQALEKLASKRAIATNETWSPECDNYKMPTHRPTMNRIKDYEMLKFDPEQKVSVSTVFGRHLKTLLPVEIDVYNLHALAPSVVKDEIIHSRRQLSPSFLHIEVLMLKSPSRKLMMVIREYCREDTLAKRLQHGFLSERRALFYFKQLLTFVRTCAVEGIAHEPLVPEKIMLKGEVLKVKTCAYYHGEEVTLRDMTELSDTLHMMLTGTVNIVKNTSYLSDQARDILHQCRQMTLTSNRSLMENTLTLQEHAWVRSAPIQWKTKKGIIESVLPARDIWTRYD